MTLAIVSTSALILALLVMHTIDALDKLREKIVSTQDSINAITAQLVKAKAEIIAKLADVQAQVDAAGVADQVDLGPLTDIAQALDDVVADPEAPADAPVA